MARPIAIANESINECLRISERETVTASAKIHVAVLLTKAVVYAMLEIATAIREVS